ncbi:MAG: TerC family protein, partial [Ignavibacteriaceae bacterium]|nr:TerC family protein [Ignavibacteriaceae bacterium]
MERELTDWIVFWIVVAILFYIDLYVSERRVGRITLKASLMWSAIWIITALLFNTFLYFDLGKQKAIEFLTGYLIEKSLSVDNLFV